MAREGIRNGVRDPEVDRFTCEALFSTLTNVDFDPAAGATLELGWKWVALTYTALDYSANGGSLDGSAIGVSFSYLFGKRY